MQATRRNASSGQALAEMGLVVLLLITMLFGIIEFGRMLMLTNMVVHAARDGARIAAVTPGSAPYTDAETHVTQLLQSTGGNLSVTSSNDSDPVSGVNTVTMTVTGNIPYLFGFFGSGALQVDRSVTFRQEAAANNP